MKKLILIIGVFGVIICLHAHQQEGSEAILKQNAFHQGGSTGSWTGYVLDRRNHGDDFLSEEELHKLHEQQRHRGLEQQRDDLDARDESGHQAESEPSFFAQCQQFFIRMIAALRRQ